jgi:release factor glutamine methyltransferase
VLREAAIETWTVLSLLRTTSGFLAERGVTEPRLSAEHLLAHVLECRRLDLYLRFDRPVAESELAAYRAAVRRRLLGEPVQYITGRAAFRGVELAVDRRVLIPRPETELLVGEVLTWARAEAARGLAPAEGWRLLDLGTGSGAIAIALALELEGVGLVLASDRSVEALEAARANATRAGAERVAFVAADGLEAFRPGVRFDAVISNPPYLAAGERPALPAEVREWEPPEALFAGHRGDETLARIVAGAPERLRAGGLLALEVALGQAQSVRERIRETAGLAFLAGYRDFAGVERGVLALAR